MSYNIFLFLRPHVGFSDYLGISQSKDKASRKSLFDEVKDTQGNMDELMGLCSGVFGDSAQQGTQKKGVKRKMSVEEQDNEDSIEAFSDDERNDEDKVNTFRMGERFQDYS